VCADLYFMDEPTTGSDPASRAQVWEIAATTAAGILTRTTKSNWWSYTLVYGGVLMQARTPSQQSEWPQD
jgi:energy-coupling factor transporter ATP-binding protein EcfA2